LVLANVWDAATALLIEQVGFPAVATSSAAVAAVLGFEDDDSMEADVAFAAVSRISQAVTVPVSADIEAGYGLAPEALVEKLLGAGAAGCNLEDTDHRNRGALVPQHVQAARIAAVKEAARRQGVDIVVNARVDTYLHQLGSPDEQLREAIRRGAAYREAGADCVYPIGARDERHHKALVAGLEVINVLAGAEAPTVERLAEMGVARISLGSGLFRLALKKVREEAMRLFAEATASQRAANRGGD
jgi:2-methylisocitrate lyase-like PEP mutase family enzyme